MGWLEEVCGRNPGGTGPVLQPVSHLEVVPFKRSGRVVMKYSFPEDRKATIAADWVVESVAGAGRRALRRHGETERCVSIVSWPDRIELALRTAAGTAYAMLPGGPAGTMCSESLWVANPELPLLCLPGPYQNVGAQEQRGLCSGVRDLAGASPYGARRWPFPTAIYWLERNPTGTV